MRILLGVVTVALATLAPPAHAVPAIAHTTCGLLLVRNEAVTGELNYSGITFAVLGAVDTELAENPADVHVTCRVFRSLNEEKVVPSVVNTTVALAVGTVSFWAGDTEIITVCTATYSNGWVGSSCARAFLHDQPPAAYCDVLADIGLPACDLVPVRTRVMVVPPLPSVTP